MNKTVTIYKSLTIAVMLACVTAFEVYACNVPVFRYALERWPADPYEIVVFHDGALTDDQDAVLQWLREPPEDEYRHANLQVRTVDLDTENDENDRELFDRLGNVTLPVAAVRYPGESVYRLAIGTAPLERNALQGLLRSPARQRIAEAITDGASAVWVLVESGDKAKDERAASLIRGRLSELEQTLELPAELEGNEAFAPVDLSTGPELKIGFELISVSRNDPAENALVSMLMHMEPDLVDYVGEPMAFPVFGRGRALYALVGDGITDRNVEAACRFLVGACSCEVKDLNPGVDLLIAFDWDAGIGDTWIDEDLPPLVGITEMVRLSDADDDTAAVVTESVTSRTAGEEAVDGEHALKRNLLVMVLLLLAAAGAMTFLTLRKGTGKRA